MDVRDLIDQETRHHQQIFGNWFAHIARNTTIITDLVYVTIPDIDPHSLWGPCRWMPRVEPENVDVAEDPDSHGDAEPSHVIVIPRIVTPQAGDEAMVSFDNRKDVWVVCWWPR